MTWSIIAHDPETGEIGIAVATRAFAVGSLVPHVATGIGAVASQAFVNPFYGPKGLALLRAGARAADVVSILTEADAGRGQRQLHVMDRHFSFAAYTGADCVPWCGHAIHDSFSVAGNMLAGPEVIDETARAFQQTAHLPLAERFLAALEAGEAAGGDKRGRQSAALLVHDGEDYPLLDIRVDDHEHPLVELRRLYGVSQGRPKLFRQFQPNRKDPVGITDRAELERLIAKAVSEGRL